MNKKIINLFVILFVFYFIKLNESADCDCYLVSGPVVAAGIETTKIRCFHKADCTVPISLITGGTPSTKETLTLYGKISIRSLGAPQKYNNTYYVQANVSDNYSYCRWEDDQGVGVSNSLGIGTGAVQVDKKLTEKYRENDIYGELDFPDRDINIPMNILSDESIYFKGYKTEFYATKSDKQTTVDGTLKTGTTYDIGLDAVNFGTFTINTVASVPSGVNVYVPIEYYNHRLINGISEECCFSQMDIETLKSNSDIYANCSTGSIITQSTGITCNDIVDGDICRKIKNNQVYTKDFYYYEEITFAVVDPIYILNTAIYNPTPGVISSVSMILVPYGQYCKLYMDVPSDESKTLDCYITTSEWANGANINIPQEIKENTFLYTNRYIRVNSKCSAISFVCVSATTIIPTILDDTSFSVIRMEHINTREENANFGRGFDFRFNWGNWHFVIGMFEVLIILVALFLLGFLLFYTCWYRKCMWGCCKQWRSLDRTKDIQFYKQVEGETIEIDEKKLRDGMDKKDYEMMIKNEQRIRDLENPRMTSGTSIYM